MSFKLNVTKELQEHITANTDEKNFFKDLLQTNEDGESFLSFADLKTKTDVDRISESLEKERILHKQAKDKAGLYGMSVDEALEMQDKYNDLLLASETSKTDADATIEKRVGFQVAKLDREREKWLETDKAKDEQISKLSLSIANRDRNDQVRKLANINDIAPVYIEDCLVIAERELTLKDGEFVTDDGLTTVEYMEQFVQKRPHFKKGSHGAGANGGSGVNNKKDTSLFGKISNAGLK